MWDAQEQYWKGHEWNNSGSQPVLTGYSYSSNDYPRNNSDSRYYHEGSGASFYATNSCTIAPNVNEMVWYAVKGNPCWDGDELWTTMGHLYKGGMWLKKKAYISGFNINSAPVNGDWRTSNRNGNWSVPYTLPPISDASKYFSYPPQGITFKGY